MTYLIKISPYNNIACEYHQLPLMLLRYPNAPVIRHGKECDRKDLERLIKNGGHTRKSR